MIEQLSQSLIDELNLVKIDNDTNTDRTVYGFSDLTQNLGICCGFMIMAVLVWQSKSILITIKTTFGGVILAI